MAIKYVCDICGKDAPETKFVVPIYDRKVFQKIKTGRYNGESKIKIAEINLCDKHQVEVADALLI